MMADVPPNIHAFNLVCLTLFEKLYEAFPTPINISSNSIGVESIPKDASYEASWDAQVLAGEAITWLQEENFIRVGSTTISGDFALVRLTLKGLTVLGYIPTSLQTSATKEALIDRVKNVLASGAEKASAEGVKALVLEAFKLSAAVAGFGTGSNVVGM